MSQKSDLLWNSIETLLEATLYNDDTCATGLAEFYTLSNQSDNCNRLIEMACCLQIVISNMRSKNNEKTLWAVSAIYNLSFGEYTKGILSQMDECLIGLAKAASFPNPEELNDRSSCREYALCTLVNLLYTHERRTHFSYLQNGKWAHILDSLTVVPPPPVPSAPINPYNES